MARGQKNGCVLLGVTEPAIKMSREICDDGEYLCGGLRADFDFIPNLKFRLNCVIPLKIERYICFSQVANETDKISHQGASRVESRTRRASPSFPVLDDRSGLIDTHERGVSASGCVCVSRGRQTVWAALMIPHV